MGNEIKIFEHPELGEIRTLHINDEPWFVLVDVCKVLKLSSSHKVADRLEEDERSQIPLTDSLNRRQNVTIINESGLYSVILRSDKPQAKPFRKWVTSEVLPSIRKHGAYMTPEKLEEVLLNPDVLIELATNLKQEQEKNSELTATNAALTMEINTWDDRAIINALIRTFANRRCGNNFAVAWNILYKRMRYGEKICPRKRKVHKKNGSLLDTLTDDEIKLALKQATALCEEAGLDTGAIINEVNRKKLAAKA